LDNQSSDIHWEEVVGLSSSRKLSTELQPDNLISQVFAFVLTENLYHNMAWYKMELTVALAQHPPQVFTIFVPTGRQVDPTPGYRVAKTVYEEKNGPIAEEPPVEWTSRGWLVPTAAPSPSPN
jgi:hypothetical protein